MIGRLKRWLLALVVVELTVGAHCGLCGKWMEHELTYRSWAISICEKCK
ncbi:hypothetical protein LCGC14_2409520 [marine sediment metagenome]|uniref:Uncharacterized protein n=1 Tax=marine sediment metagenome TaxID=412755 RepID=A0A0F9BSS4_9ZZZZ